MKPAPRQEPWAKQQSAFTRLHGRLRAQAQGQQVRREETLQAIEGIEAGRHIAGDDVSAWMDTWGASSTPAIMKSTPECKWIFPESVEGLKRLYEFIASMTWMQPELPPSTLRQLSTASRTFPHIGHPLEDMVGVREFVFGRYVIRYMVKGDAVYVLQWHGRERGGNAISSYGGFHPTSCTACLSTNGKRGYPLPDSPAQEIRWWSRGE